MVDSVPYQPSVLPGVQPPLQPAVQGYSPSPLPGATPSRPTSTLPISAPAPATGAYKPSPIDVVIKTESGGRNVTQSLGTRDVNNNYGAGGGHPAQGYLQVIDPTYQPYARRMGIDVSKYPSINMLPRDQQIAVASTIPFNQWGGATKRAVQAAFPNIDIRGKTLGQIQAEAGGAPVPPGATTPGTTLNTPPPQSLLGALTGGTGANGQGLSPIQQVQKDVGGEGGGQALPPAAPPQLGMPSMHNQEVAAQAPQLMAALRTASAQPLSWGSQPFGSTAGPRGGAPPTTLGYFGGQAVPMPGTTLNSIGGQTYG